MKKKNEVYVKVDTPKKAKKLKKVLDMFKEKVYDNNVCYYEDYPYLFIDEDSQWDTHNYYTRKKNEVSIKELKNILAAEHLKEGDVIIAGIGSTKYIVNVESVKPSYTAPINANKWLRIDADDYPREIQEGDGYFYQFIRYATEEEKQLLNPKKELEVGKWYKTKNTLFNYQNEKSCYGFSNGKYYDNDWHTNSEFQDGVIEEATQQEVEQALIEEAKIRYKVGDKLSKVRNDHADDNRFFESHSFGLEKNCLYFDSTNGSHYSYCIFDNGQWSDIIEQDKLAELKEAHRNGMVIQLKMGNRWFDCDPVWTPIFTYRIKPQHTFTDKDVAIIERLHDTLLDNHKYDLQSDILIDSRMLADKIKSNIK